MSSGWLVLSRFLVSYWALTGQKGFFSALGGLGSLNLAWMGWGIWIRTVKSLQQNRLFFLTWRYFKVWSFQKCKCSRGYQWEKEGFWNFKLTEVLLRTSKRRLSWYKFQRGARVHSFIHFSGLHDKIIGSQIILGFQKNYL